MISNAPSEVIVDEQGRRWLVRHLPSAYAPPGQGPSGRSGRGPGSRFALPESDNSHSHNADMRFKRPADLPSAALADLTLKNEPYDPPPPPIFRDAPPPPPAEGLKIEQPDWREEEREAAEREAREKSKTPNLNRVNGWRYKRGSS
jgi:hypothetical protein